MVTYLDFQFLHLKTGMTKGELIKGREGAGARGDKLLATRTGPRPILGLGWFKEVGVHCDPWTEAAGRRETARSLSRHVPQRGAASGVEPGPFVEEAGSVLGGCSGLWSREGWAVPWAGAWPRGGGGAHAAEAAAAGSPGPDA